MNLLVLPCRVQALAFIQQLAEALLYLHGSIVVLLHHLPALFYHSLEVLLPSLNLSLQSLVFSFQCLRTGCISHFLFCHHGGMQTSCPVHQVTNLCEESLQLTART